MQIKFVSIIMQTPPPPSATYSLQSLVSQAHVAPWQRANHFKRLRNTAALSSRRRLIHFLFHIFLKSEFIGSFMFKSIPFGSRRNRSAGCSWVKFRPRGVSPSSYANTGSQRAGYSASNDPCKHADGARVAGCADQEVLMWCTLANSDWIVFNPIRSFVQRLFSLIFRQFEN